MATNVTGSIQSVLGNVYGKAQVKVADPPAEKTHIEQLHDVGTEIARAAKALRDLADALSAVKPSELPDLKLLRETWQKWDAVPDAVQRGLTAWRKLALSDADLQFIQKISGLGAWDPRWQQLQPDLYTPRIAPPTGVLTTTTGTVPYYYTVRNTNSSGG